MQVFDQADPGRDNVVRYSDFAGDGVVAGLGVVALVGDWADDGDAAVADQVGGTARGQGGVQVMGDAVVLDHCAVAVGAAVQAGAVTVGRRAVAEQTGQGHAVAELARGADQQDLLAGGGRVPFLVGSGAQGQPRQPGGGQFTGFYTHARGLHLDFGDNAEADEVFEHAGEGGEIVHGADGGAACVRVQLLLLVDRPFTVR